MSADESIPDDDEFEDEAEREGYLRYVYEDLRIWWIERADHDERGFYAEMAGSAECLALGHKPDPDEGWDTGDDHPYGWGDEPICLETRHGIACSQCEGDCDFQRPRLRLWELVSTESRHATSMCV